MDPVSDAIDPSWWDDVLAPAALDDPYEPPELLSTHLERAAADPAVTGFEELVLQVLAMVSSAMLNAEDWLEPFTPAMQFRGKRTVVPADLGADQVALLARIAPLNRPRSRDWPEATKGWLLCQHRGSTRRSCGSERCDLSARPVSRIRSCR
jgi:hypothetical protein